MWRNHFTCDVLAENGSAHIESLCKWGPVDVHPPHARAAERPSARGKRDARAGRSDLGARVRALQAALRATASRPICRTISGCNRTLERLGDAVGHDAEARRERVRSIGFAGMTHLGLVSASAVAARGLRHRLATIRDAALRRASSTPASCRSSSPASTSSSRGNAGRQYLHRAARRSRRVRHRLHRARCADRRRRRRAISPRITALIDAVSRARSRRMRCWSCCARCRPASRATLGAAAAERLYYQVETWCSAARSSGRRSRSATSSAAPIRRRPLPMPDSRQCSSAFGCPILPMRYESAELAKISINCCLVASITVANTLAELCERIGADWSRDRPGAQARPPHRALQPI